MELFADFKIEMPVLTLLVVAITRNIFVLPITSFVALCCVLLALRFRVGWWLGLGVCLLCDLIFAAQVLPMLALINGLGGAVPLLFVPMPLLQFSTVGAGSVFSLVNLVLTQIIFVALLFRRRDFSK